MAEQTLEVKQPKESMFSKKNMKALREPFSSNNPITFQVLGICSALAVTVQMNTALVMTLAVTFVLTLSNVAISLLRKSIPSKIRIIIELAVIASLVIFVDQILKAFLYDISKQLSVFVGLIITNCIIMGRAEAFASKNSLLDSIADALGVGLGFTLALLTLGITREVLGNGTFWGYPIFGQNFTPVLIFVLPPGAFLVLGVYLGLFNWIDKKRKLSS